METWLSVESFSAYRRAPSLYLTLGEIPYSSFHLFPLHAALRSRQPSVLFVSGRQTAARRITGAAINERLHGQVR